MTNAEESKSKEKVSWLIFIPAMASLVPFVGIPFGISTILWGIADWKIGGKKAVTLAFLGFLLTLLFGLYFYSVVGSLPNSPATESLKADSSQNSLSFLVRCIEYYKIGHERYPSSLNDLKESDIRFKEPAFVDPVTTAIGMPVGGSEERQYYYEVSQDGQSYVLFSVGADKIPFTEDDIYPMVLEEYKSVIGLLPKP